MKTWTEDELKAALQAYDKRQGDYPESRLEGFAIWQWLMTGGEGFPGYLVPTTLKLAAEWLAEWEHDLGRASEP